MWTRKHKGNVFVGNLPRDFDDERLAEAFDAFGIVLSAKVARDPNTGDKLRYGFVDIATERAATAAITALHGTVIDGCKLNVRPTDKPVRKPGMAAPRRQPLRRAGPAPRPSFANDEGPAPAAERPAPRNFQVEVVRRRTPTLQIERRPLRPRGA